jgi:parvulin-like peptidyl-prolyl isomerase
MKIRLGLLTAALPLALYAQSGGQDTTKIKTPTAPETVDRVVAVVNSQPILMSQVRARAFSSDKYRDQLSAVAKDSVAQEKLMRQVLDELIDEELLVQKAAELKVEVNEAQIKQAADNQIKTIRGQYASDTEFMAALKETGFGSLDEYQRLFIESYRREALQYRVVQSLQRTLRPVLVTDSEVTAGIERRKEELKTRPQLVSFLRIVVLPRPSEAARAKAKAKAESLLAELKRGANFDEMVKRETMDPTTRDSLGRLGWFRQGHLVPEYEAVAYKTKPGHVASVIAESRFGFHIIRTNRMRPGEINTSHILITAPVDSSDVRIARARADTAATLWRAGVSFDSLVKRFHTEPVIEKGIPNPVILDSIPRMLGVSEQQAPYPLMLRRLKPGDVSDSFASKEPNFEQGFVVVKILTMTPKGDLTSTETREMVRENLQQAHSLRLLLDELRRNAYVSVRM